MDEIRRMRKMAHEAIWGYNAELQRGGEPNYPTWADDLLHVCDQAELADLAPEKAPRFHHGDGIHPEGGRQSCNK